MTEINQEFLDIVTQIRTHLEYQKALGVRVIGSTPSGSIGAGSPPAVKVAPGKTIEPSAHKPQLAQAPGLSAVREELGTCTRCALHQGGTAIVFGEGNPEAALVFIGDSPGQEEAREGRPFAGPAGQLLTDIIVKGMKLKREDVYFCTIVKCPPPGDRNPERAEIAACEPFLEKQIQAIKPRVIVALGNAAATTLLKTTEDILALRGKWHTYNGIPLMPTLHPAYLLDHPSEKKLVWDDIRLVMAKLGMKI